MSDEDKQHHPMPPASFSGLVQGIYFQAQVALGFLGFPKDDDQPDLEGARHGIDLLAVLHEKSKGNLTLEEQRHLENSLTELRFRFVQVSEEMQKKAAVSGGTEAQTA